MEEDREDEEYRHDMTEKTGHVNVSVKERPAVAMVGGPITNYYIVKK